MDPDPDPKFKVHFGSFLVPGCIYKDVEQYSVIKFEHWETSRNFEKLRVCLQKNKEYLKNILYNIAFKVTYKEKLSRKMILKIYTQGSGSDSKYFGSTTLIVSS